MALPKPTVHEQTQLTEFVHVLTKTLPFGFVGQFLLFASTYIDCTVRKQDRGFLLNQILPWKQVEIALQEYVEYDENCNYKQQQPSA
nr:hypothetical protein [Okeania sp. SIO2G5]